MSLGVEDKDGYGDIEISEDLVHLPNYKQPNTASIDFDGLLQTPLILHEDVSAGCGGQTWPAGMVLAKYLLREPQRTSLHGKMMLELGAGSGLVGLALALALIFDLEKSEKVRSSIQMTDQDAMLALMQRNIELNPLARGLVSASVLDWGTSVAKFTPPDVLIAAECVYFEPAFPLLLQTMTDLIGPYTTCYFCFKKRRRADLRFIKEARKKFKVEDVVDDPDREIWSKQSLFFYKITLK